VPVAALWCARGPLGGPGGPLAFGAVVVVGDQGGGQVVADGRVHRGPSVCWGWCCPEGAGHRCTETVRALFFGCYRRSGI
jgi:hypothetical protein